MLVDAHNSGQTRSMRPCRPRGTPSPRTFRYRLAGVSGRHSMPELTVASKHQSARGRGKVSRPRFCEHGYFPPRNDADGQGLRGVYLLHDGGRQRIRFACQPANPDMGVEQDHFSAFQSASGMVGDIKSPVIRVAARCGDGRRLTVPGTGACWVRGALFSSTAAGTANSSVAKTITSTRVAELRPGGKSITTW